MRPIHVICLALFVAAARAQEEPGTPAGAGRLDAGDRAYASWELLRGGQPFQEELFRLGWPTSKAWQRLTLELAGEPGSRMVQATLASGAGMRLSASEYERSRAERLSRAGEAVQGPAALLRREILAYRSIAGLPAEVNIPGGFDPTFLPAWRAEAKTTRPWAEDDLGSWAWVEPQAPTYRLDTLGFTLLAEVEYARQQLSYERTEDLAGRKTKYLGRTGRDGFFGLLALHSAVAKALELKSLVFDLKTLGITSTSEPLKLDELRFFFGAGWTSTVGADGRISHVSLQGSDWERSYLRGQAAVLLGLCNLAALCDPTAPAPLPDLFKPRQLAGQNVPMFEKETFATVVELAIYTFRSLRTLHVDVRDGRAISVSGGRTITAADLGLYLCAIEAFRNVTPPTGPAVQGPQASLWKDLQDEQGKGRTLLNALSEQVRSWDDQRDPGVYDVYDVKSNQRATRTRSLASQAMCVRGLMAAHRGLARGAPRSPYSVTAERLLRYLERDRWVAATGAYLEPKSGAGARSTSLLGAAAVLGALRETALAGDGRALLRYQQCLEGLSQRGLYAPPADRAPPSLAGELRGES